jgi:hypothetical protein
MNADEIRAAVERRTTGYAPRLYLTTAAVSDLNRRAEALREEAERLAPRLRGPLSVSVRSSSDRFTASEVIAELSSLGAMFRSTPAEERRVLFIGGPLDGQRVRTPVDGDRKEVWKHHERFVYQIETVDIAGEPVTLGILDTPEALPPLVKAALDRVAEAVAEAERLERKAAAALAREERDRRQDACQHRWTPIWDADPWSHPDAVVAWCPACGLGQGPTLRRFRDFGDTMRSSSTVRG